MKKIFFLMLIINLASCRNQEEWYCKVDGKTMYSLSESGKLGSADKGCSCDEIRSFELKIYGEVDEQALKDDFGC
ncbi:MAG: hypothetical protein ACRBHB_25175 [Arenicella sp.]